MNPDIQRIAEKWFPLGTTRQPFTQERQNARSKCISALTELSALRDTQERELREKLKEADVSIPTAVKLQIACFLNREIDNRTTLGALNEVFREVNSLRAELARREERITELEMELTVESSTSEIALDHLRSRIGELEKLLKDLEGESFERDILG